MSNENEQILQDLMDKIAQLEERIDILESFKDEYEAEEKQRSDVWAEEHGW